MEIRREIFELYEKGVTLHNEGNYREAAKVLEQGKQMAEENLDTKDKLRLRVLCYLGETYISNGEFMKAQAVLEDILSVQRQETPNVLLADTLHALCKCYHNQYKSMDATTRLLKESLSIYQKYVSANDVRVAKTTLEWQCARAMDMLGRCFMRQGNLSDAERILRESLEIIKSARPEDPVSIANGQLSLAQCLYQQGKESESIELTKECVRIWKSHFHLRHPSVATAVYQLGSYLMESGKLDESEDYVRESLEICRHSFHEKHPNTAMSLKRLGQCLMRKGKDEEAEKLLSEAVDIERVSLPQNHRDKICTFMSWSKSLSNIADYTRAHHALLESLQIININKLPSNSFERLEVNRLLKRLSTFQQQQHEETIIPEEKEGIEETDASHNSGSEWLTLVAKSLTGEAVELKAKASDTVATLKHQLQTKDEPSSWDQLLLLNKKQLHNEQTLADAGVTDGTILSVVLCPRGVTGMGADAGELFVRALSQGAVEVSRVKIVIVGKDRTGKTSFKRSLLKQKFQIIQPSTPVAMAELAVCEASNWRLVKDKDQEFLDKQIARAAMHAMHDSSANVSGSEGESQSDDGRADWPHLHSRVDLDSTVGRESTSTDTRVSYVDEVIVLTEGIARAIRDFQSDPDLLKKEDSKVHVTIWDLGGQEPLLPGQGQAITSGCVVCVVFNASQFLGDKAKSFYVPFAKRRRQS
ncbi:uncharacterized protein LOC134177728 [Corticium candelabrum]|uniref:uncharacterized protein LOC134177728 n=1 Tax=Corticium candelabrum TaxID=121492 RepID=UPI002E265524|nr:uncharacterized protein LOC134177728 [Corticium candelabrum]